MNGFWELDTLILYIHQLQSTRTKGFLVDKKIIEFYEMKIELYSIVIPIARK